MTTLNWTKDRANRQPKEQSFDDLPPAGSYQDQRRYGIYPRASAGGNRQSARPYTAQATKSINDFDQLEKYVQHARHPDFKRKLACQKAEVIQIVRSLIVRCEAYFADPNSHQLSLLRTARNTLTSLSH